jgi:pyruvate dehydrogenase E1 component beta subunit
MREITFAEATLEAMREEMRRDPRVFVMGEDIARQGGIFGQFKGLPEEFGYTRVIDTPISETAIVGAGLGAALTGSRPVIDMHFADFMTIASDEIINQIAKIRYMSGGQAKVPLVIRAPDGAIRSAAAQHSQSVEAWYMNVPGLQIVAPATPYDAKGLLKSAIRSDNPVIYFENKVCYRQKGPVPEEEYLVPLGKAEVKRPGKDATVITYSIMLYRCLEAADLLAQEGLDIEVIDLRTLAPLDTETLVASVKKTGHALVAHEAVRFGGFGAEVAATLQELAFDWLDAPIARVGAAFTPVPFSPPLEKAVIPQVSHVVEAVKALVA